MSEPVTTSLGGPPAAGPAVGGGVDQRRTELLRLAQQFEAMLLTQMLRDMRKASTWSDEEDSGQPGLGGGFDALSDTIDSELALQLARTKSIGVADDLARAFARIGSAAGSLQLPAVNTVSDPVSTVPHAEDVEGASATTGPSAVHVTSPFGWRTDPLTGAMRFHRGVDVRAAYGEDVRAAAAGTVVVSGTQGGYGTTVVVEHQDGTRTRYAHLSARSVEVGATVDAGEVLGRAGQSGRATGPHLHFEVTTASGQALSPGEWMQKWATVPET